MDQDRVAGSTHSSAEADPAPSRTPLPDLRLAGLHDAERPQIKAMVYQRLVQAIVDHELPPGTHLRERDLAERMGVSKTPIREALVRMETEKLVSIAPYRGAVVRTISRTDLRELYELRELLEGFCARVAARSATDESEERMRANVRATQRAIDNGEVDQVAQLLEDFDTILHQHASGHRIEALLADLEAQLRLFGRLTFRAPGRQQASLAEHVAILQAVVMRDPEAAEQACRRHVRSVYAELTTQLWEAAEQE
ncbi:GntR family transcriptional regulator [Pseudactinotalea sp.]|uniref:GntR family transcriptional regulator n=1 Tax=Pseudactinotalea sp. TaxID=1926260 RepID=UPI003B3A389A